MFNPQPVFTETFALKVGSPATQYQLGPNLGGVIAVSISQVPQLAQYTSLYQKYRILKAKFICIPLWNTESADINASSYNLSLAPPVLATGLSRIVYAVNDSPALVAPVSEDTVLQENGCKILCGKSKIVMSCRPVPNVNDANGVQMTFKQKFINFATAGPDVPHYGISWWHTQAGTGGLGTGIGVPYQVYCKLTFQLSDPR